MIENHALIGVSVGEGNGGRQLWLCYHEVESEIVPEKLLHSLVKVWVIEKLVLRASGDDFSYPLEHGFVKILIKKDSDIVTIKWSPANNASYEVVRFLGLLQEEVVLAITAARLHGDDLVDTTKFKIEFKIVDLVVLLQVAHLFRNPWEVSGFVFPEMMVGVDHVAKMLGNLSLRARAMLIELCQQIEVAWLFEFFPR